MPSPPGEGDLDEIFVAMAALENTDPLYNLKQVNAAFNAYAYMPTQEELRNPPFPFSMRLVKQWMPNPRNMGSETKMPLEIRIRVLILVGILPNDIGKLTKQAQKYIKPLIRLYMANRSVSGTIRGGLDFELGYMGGIILQGIKYFGIEQPLILPQRVLVKNES
jgi:hypothetical protein